jgi:hypothetical protein
MKASSAVASIVLTLGLGCWRGGSEPRAYAAGHAADIVASTRPLWTAHRKSGQEVPPSEWPAHVRALEPSRVVVSSNGLYLYVRTSYTAVTGVFVRHEPTFEPPGKAAPDSDDHSYERLAPDVYWFSMPR